MFIAEVGDQTWFDNARELMAYVGLTLWEYSSGARWRRGLI